jgi:hypothetical protein
MKCLVGHAFCYRYEWMEGALSRLWLITLLEFANIQYLVVNLQWLSTLTDGCDFSTTNCHELFNVCY